jgi:hypothetical protein
MPDIRDRFVRNIGPVVEPPGKQIAGPMTTAALPCQFLSKLLRSEGFICPTLIADGVGSFIQNRPLPKRVRALGHPCRHFISARRLYPHSRRHVQDLPDGRPLPASA